MTIQAIETRYAGCRFRSRLEARWAVFFDHLGITWEYEPQGYLVGGKPYLPDFRIPELDLWVEVKGSLDAETLSELVAAAAALPFQQEPDVLGGPNVRLLILGGIPAEEGPGGMTPHLAIYRIGQLYALADVRFDGCATVFGVEPYRSTVGPRMVNTPIMLGPAEVAAKCALHLADVIEEVEPYPLYRNSGRVCAAYTAARSARFEHGESPDAPW